MLVASYVGAWYLALVVPMYVGVLRVEYSMPLVPCHVSIYELLLIYRTKCYMLHASAFTV